MSRKHSIVVYGQDSFDDEDEGQEEDPREKTVDPNNPNSHTALGNFSVGITTSAAAAHIFKELRIATPHNDPLGAVLTPSGASLAVVV